MNNNIKILGHPAESIALAENSTSVLDRALGQHDPDVRGSARLD
jgi:hypothetical protein